MSAREPSDFTIVELKEKLKDLGLSLALSKSESVEKSLIVLVASCIANESVK